MSCANNFAIRISAYSEEILSSSDKSEPYVSKKNVSNIISLNSKVQIDGESLVCNHLSALYVSESIRHHNNGKKLRIHDLFGSTSSIMTVARRASLDNIRDLPDRLISKSCNKYIIVCRRFGVFLREIAIDTKINCQRVFLLRSCDHTMALRVICKLKTNHLGNIGRRYVVHFFDPNKTNVVARSEVDNPDLFLNEEKFSLNKFTGSYYSVYFEKLLSAPKEHELMVYECSSNNIIGSESLLVFETLIHDGISECALYHLMENGICTKNIMMMSERLSLLPSSVRESIVYGRSSLGIQALHVALTNNRHNSIHAYCYLLRGLSDNEKLRVLPNLLTANNMRGESGLFMAMQEGSADAISAFGSLLDMLLSLKWKMSPNVLANTIFNLIEARRREGRRDTGLFMAMQGGRSSAVFAFRRLLDRLISLSGAVSVNSIAKMIFYILMSVNNRGVSGLFIAMQEGHSSSIYSFGSLLDRLVFVGNNIPKYSLDDMVFDILLARSGSVSNGLFSAIKNSRLGAIRAYCSLLSRISKHRWVDLLEAKNNYGMPGILLANGKTINFYLDVLSGFTIDVLSKLHYRLGNIRYTRKYIEYANSRNGLETARYENFLLGLEKIIRSKAALPTLPHKF